GVSRKEERAQNRPQPRLPELRRGALQFLQDGQRRRQRVELMLRIVVDRHVAPSVRSPRWKGSVPASILSKVDLPAPFGPPRAARAPRSTSKSTPAYTTLSPYALWMPLSVATRRPVRGGWGNAKWITRASRSTWMRSMRSSIFTRLWTCRALLALYRQRSMQRLISAIRLAWFRACSSSSSRRACRWTRYWSSSP